MTKRFPSPPGMRPGPVLVIIGHYAVGDATKTFGRKNVLHDSRERAADARRRRSRRSGFSLSPRSPPRGRRVPRRSRTACFKSGAKLLGFATDVAPPADFVSRSRPAGDLDFIPVFQPPPEPARPALKDTDLKAIKGDLDAVQKQARRAAASLPAGRQGDR